MTHTLRTMLAGSRRVVVKFGTRVLVDSKGRPDEAQLSGLVRQLADLHDEGREVVCVTSGAIGSGMEAMGWGKRPKILSDLQMAAAVGQSRLMSSYAKLFAKREITVGQVLLTYDDLRHRVRHLNARNTMNALLRNRVIPIVNENDVTSVDEIKVGDNDVLAALVTALIGAELLVLLSSTDGLRAPVAGGNSGRTKRIAYLPAVTERELALVFGKGSELSVGGMESKLRAAQTAVRAGAAVVIADGRVNDVIGRVVAGEDVGTLIGGPSARMVDSGRKRWIAFFHRPRGTIVVDDGACTALETRGRSLLPTGVRAVEGNFQKGATVNVRSLDGNLIARGLVEYSSGDLVRIQGKKTSEIAGVIGSKDADEVIHRDNLVLLRGGEGEVI